MFPLSEDVITVEPCAIPAHWPRICGIAFGWEHPTAAAWLAWDRGVTLYVTDCYRRSETPMSTVINRDGIRCQVVQAA